VCARECGVCVVCVYGECGYVCVHDCVCCGVLYVCVVGCVCMRFVRVCLCVRLGMRVCSLPQTIVQKTYIATVRADFPVVKITVCKNAYSLILS
jgi:hypothetical protein